MKNILNKIPSKSNHFKNAAIESELSILSAILQKEKNVVVYQRAVKEMKTEIETLLKLNVQLRLSGSKKQILEKISNKMEACNCHVPLFTSDIIQLLEQFKRISGVASFRLNLFAVNSNMCQRFHTDINDLRLLCTYSGQGTFWLPEEAADRNNHHDGGQNEEIVLKPELIQQANEGDVLILKGALFPNAKAAIHRSPSIEESGEIRLLLRIDTNESSVFD